MEASLPYACLLIDRHKPGVYSTLHLVDQVWWDWLHQPAPAALRRQSAVEITLPAGRVTGDGERTCAGSVGSFSNDLMHVVADCPQGTKTVRFGTRDAWVDEDQVRSDALAACAAAGIPTARITEGLWY